MMVLRARGLSVAPPASPECVIRDLSLELAPGEWLAVSGANGTGKTTLALALAGLWPIAAGALELEGRPFGPHSGSAGRAALAVVLQDPSSQLLQSTVADELTFAARNLGRGESEVDCALARWSERFGLGPDLPCDPRALSAGRQQLVLLAAALMTAPRLLIADEPCSHLDSLARAASLAAVREEVERGLAVLWVTQDPDELTAAHRRLDLGAAPASTAAPAPTAPRVAPAPTGNCAAALRLEIEPDSGAAGPRVRTSRRLEITLGSRGVTALTGRNGAGKSVVLACAAGVMDLSQIKVSRPMGAEPPPILAAQYPEHQIFEERVEDEVAYAAVSRGLTRAEALGRAAECFAALGLAPAFLGRRCWDLSGGEKRLLEVVAALIAPASLLAIDEPTAGLDPHRKGALADLLALRGGQGPILAATQDSGWIKQLSARQVELGC